MLQVNLVSSTRNSATEPGMMFFLWRSLFSKESLSHKAHVCLLLRWEQSPQKDTVWVSVAVWRFFFVSLLKNVWFSVLFFQQFSSWQHLKPDFELLWGWWNMAPTSPSLWRFTSIARLHHGVASGTVTLHYWSEGNLVPLRHLVKYNKHLLVSKKSFLSFFFFFLNSFLST